VNDIKQFKSVKKFRKTKWYSRFRQYFPQREFYHDDRGKFAGAEEVRIDWPEAVKKPRFGLVRDFGPYPRWTKYCRFLETNSFPYEIYPLHSHDWIDKAAQFEIIVGMSSSELSRLHETREKYHFLEYYLGKVCYPSSVQVMLYENKRLEAYISHAYGLPFAETKVSHEEEDALKLVTELSYPVVSKIDPSSGSAGVDLIKTAKQARKIIHQAFSGVGRKTHLAYTNQKDYTYFQKHIPNDGYDIRAIVVGNWVFGYYRKVLEGDFRASGMNLVEKRALPGEAMRIARRVNEIIKSPMLVVDIMHGLDGEYYVIEFSPFCQMETPEQLHVNGIPGVYIFETDEIYHFEECRYWVAELALREFLVKDYLPKMQ
jgi:glutathione synthase/RimK-type ligase-like ATP-grasp enzyme